MDLFAKKEGLLAMLRLMIIMINILCAALCFCVSSFCYFCYYYHDIIIVTVSNLFFHLILYSFVLVFVYCDNNTVQACRNN